MAPTSHSLAVSSLADLAAARSWLRRVVDGLDVRRDDAELVATELLSNAIRHARSSAALVVTVAGDHVRIAVTDGSSGRPSVSAEPSTTGGYGMHLVERISSRWGWDPRPDGKTVWCELPRRGGAAGDPAD